MPDIIGWSSSVVLLATLFAQILKQWREQNTRGVSKWLFVGQTAASTGFTIYSILLENWVFTVTNALLLVAGLTGFFMTLHLRRRQGHVPAQRTSTANGNAVTTFSPRASGLSAAALARSSTGTSASNA